MTTGGVLWGARHHQQGVKTRTEHPEASGTWRCLGALVLTTLSLLLPSATKELREHGRTEGTEAFREEILRGIIFSWREAICNPLLPEMELIQRSSPLRGDGTR